MGKDSYSNLIEITQISMKIIDIYDVNTLSDIGYQV